MFCEGAHKVQIDFTEGRLAVKIDPSGALLKEPHRAQQPRAQPLFRGRRGYRRSYLPGVGQGSTHSAEVDDAELLPNCSSSRRVASHRAGWGTGSHACAQMIRQYLSPDIGLRRKQSFLLSTTTTEHF